MANGKVDWRGKQVLLEVQKATAQSLEAAALAIEGETKAGIVAADAVDTGFMLNSVYVVAQAGADTYGDTDESGTYYNKTTGMVERNIAPKADLGQAQALVAIGAEYAIFQEEKHAFLYQAAEKVAQQMGGLIKQV